MLAGKQWRVARAGLQVQYRLLLVRVRHVCMQHAVCYMCIYMAAPQSIAFVHEVLRVVLYIAACASAAIAPVSSDRPECWPSA